LNINEEHKNLLDKKEKYKNISLFKDRNLILVSHIEEIFLKKKTVEEIEKQKPSNIKRIFPINNKVELKQAKKQILKSLINTRNPMTFMFE
jgi:ADP-dependent phosphofructokinase/glucokinase